MFLALSILAGFMLPAIFLIWRERARDTIWTKDELEGAMPQIPIHVVPRRWRTFPPEPFSKKVTGKTREFRRAQVSIQTSFLNSLKGAKTGVILMVPFDKMASDLVTAMSLVEALQKNGHTIALLDLSVFRDVNLGFVQKIVQKNRSRDSSSNCEGLYQVSFISDVTYAQPAAKDFDGNAALIDGSAQRFIDELVQKFEFVIVMAADVSDHPAIIRLLQQADRVILSCQLGKVEKNMLETFNIALEEDAQKLASTVAIIP